MHRSTAHYLNLLKMSQLKFLERLDGLAGSGQHTENVESDLDTHPISTLDARMKDNERVSLV